METFDPTDPAFVADPYPVYESLRAEQGLVRFRDLWLVSRHRDVDAILRDRRFGRVFTPKEPVGRYGPWNRVNERSMLELEPPEHTRLRQLVAKEFTPRRVEHLRARVRQLVDGLLDDLSEQVLEGDADLIAGLAEPLPVEVIAELLGIPEQDRRRLRPWSNDIVLLYELEPDPTAPDRAISAAAEFDAYLRELIMRRQAEPGEDLFSALAVMPGERLTEDELVATAVLLLNAGHEASVNVLGNGVLALLQHPDQLRRLMDDSRLVRPCVEELIRYDSPLSLFTRTAFTEISVAGQTISPGEQVGLLLASANRDPDAFPDPASLDIAREPNPHVGFGAGIHYCLGAPLARLELQEALAGLFGRFTDLTLVEEPELRPTFQFRGVRSLRVSGDTPRR